MTFFVYFAERESDGMVKVGFTRCLKQRVSSLTVEIGEQVYLLGAFEVSSSALARQIERNCLSALGCTFKGTGHEWVKARRYEVCRIARVFQRQDFVLSVRGFSEEDEANPDQEDVWREAQGYLRVGSGNGVRRGQRVCWHHQCATAVRDRKEARRRDLQKHMPGLSLA